MMSAQAHLGRLLASFRARLTRQKASKASAQKRSAIITGGTDPSPRSGLSGVNPGGWVRPRAQQPVIDGIEQRETARHDEVRPVVPQPDGQRRDPVGAYPAKDGGVAARADEPAEARVPGTALRRGLR